MSAFGLCKLSGSLLVGLVLFSSLGLSQVVSPLPSAETRSAIESLPIEPRSIGRNRGGAGGEPDLREYRVDPEKLPPSTREGIKADSQGVARTPLLVPNTLIIQFEQDASKDSIENLLRARNLKVLERFPSIGAIKVEVDLSKYFAPQLTDSNSNQTLLRGINNIIEDYKKESIVRSVSPDVALRTPAESQTAKNITTASDITVSSSGANTEATDWGVGDIEADQLWNLPGAHDGALFGVMDVGFGRHEDITFIELPRKIDVADHGNHVAGIACGRHNGRGIRGVLPNCFVRARAGDVFFRTVEGGQVLGFIVVFSQILATLENFLGQYDDIHVFNVSMGYNWQSNFGINPDLPESAAWRTLVESQGTILVSSLALADKAGKVIFSAAGNDSSGLATPIGARYASPFNWAAVTAREKGIARNGIVVEAHDAAAKRADFSNVGGNVSCPGVDILSSVAHDTAGKTSEAAYGKMSGTSMASPYCAAAHELLQLVRPGYSASEITDCLLASAAKSDTGVPIPKLTQALSKCPARD